MYEKICLCGSNMYFLMDNKVEYIMKCLGCGRIVLLPKDEETEAKWFTPEKVEVGQVRETD